MNKKHLKIILSLIPLLTLLGMLAVSIGIFGSNSILGASQVALLFSAGVSCAIALSFLHVKWSDIETEIAESIKDVAPAIVILLLIGALSGTWTMSGIVPTLITYGIHLISPKFFLLTACVICCIISLTVGSSWTTIATIGVALLGIGRALGFSDGLIAGAIISGAYFGDKVSPLSETTVMASSIGGTPLFEHIRYMMYTTVPSIVITMIIFTVIGLMHSSTSELQVALYTDTLNAKFNLSPWLLLVPVATGFMIYKKWPAIVVLSLAVLMAAVTALVAQPQIISEIATGRPVECGLPDVEGVDQADCSARTMFMGLSKTIYDEVGVVTGSEAIDNLVSTRGMTGMLNTIFLIICAMCFGGCMKATKMIHHIASLLMPLSKSRTGLVASTVTSGVALNGIVSDQYLAIILTSNLYKDIYAKRGYENRLLTRSVEDSATVTSPIFPWSSCGMTQATILGVSTLVYAPFCFFNILSPLMSIFVAALFGKKMTAGVKVPQK